MTPTDHADRLRAIHDRLHALQSPGWCPTQPTDGRSPLAPAERAEYASLVNEWLRIREETSA